MMRFAIFNQDVGAPGFDLGVFRVEELVGKEGLGCRGVGPGGCSPSMF